MTEIQLLTSIHRDLAAIGILLFGTYAMVIWIWAILMLKK